MRRPLAAVALAVLLMTALAVVRWNVWTYGTDTGTFAQIALNAFSAFRDGPEHGSHFHFHWSPIVAVLWPVVALTRSPFSLQIVQVLLICATALPLAAIVRSYAGDAWAARAAVLALVYPPLLSAAFEEFHELAFYPVLALALFWSADRARWGWFALCAFALALIREDVSVDMFVAGAALGTIGVVKRRQSSQQGLLLGEPREPLHLCAAGFGLAGLCAAALLFYALVVVPRVGGWAPAHLYRYPFANGPIQTAAAVFTHPLAIGSSVLTLGRLTYLLEAFAPLAFLPLLTRWTWLAAPGLVGVLLASDSLVWRMGFHYELLWAPWLLLGAAWALVRIAVLQRGKAERWWVAAVALCTVVLVAFNPMHPAHYLAPAHEQNPNLVARAFECVPHGAPVMTHDEWFAHMALAYPNATNLEEPASFDGYLVYAGEWRNRVFELTLLPRVVAARRRGRLAVVCRFGDVTVLRPSRTAESRARRYSPHRYAAKS